MKPLFILIALACTAVAETREVVRDAQGKVIATVDRPSSPSAPAVIRNPQGKVIATDTMQGRTTVRRDANGKVTSTKTK